MKRKIHMSKPKKTPDPIVTLPEDEEVILTGSFLPTVEVPAVAPQSPWPSQAPRPPVAPAPAKAPEPPEDPPEDEGDDEIDRDDDECEADAECCAVEVEPPQVIEVLDWTKRAAKTIYNKTKRVKRTRYPKVNLSRRRVFVVVHQTAFEWRADNPYWHKVTAHYVILPDARVVQLHPHWCKLIASNMADVRPAMSINIEIAGNFEAIDGSGKFFKPEKFGRGRATDAQLAALRLLIPEIKRRAKVEKWEIAGVIPHISAHAGKTQCPGSRVWAVAEKTAIDLGLPIPGRKLIWTKRGGYIPDAWRSSDFLRLGRGKVIAA